MSENPSQTQISRLAEFCPNNAITTDQIFPQMSRYPRNSSEELSFKQTVDTRTDGRTNGWTPGEDGSANVAVYRQLAADCDFDISSRERESEKEITEGCLQINYVFLKNEMESCDLLDHLHSIDLFSEEFLETCRETPRRRRRNDLIIKEIFKIAKNTSKEILQHFVEALCMTGQEHIVNYLLAHKYPPKLENQIPTVPMDFLISMSHRIIEDVEPREIIDNLLETKAISFLDHEDVEQIQYRKDRVKFILQMADQSSHSSAEIKRAIKATYSKLFEEYERRAEKNAINQQVSVSIRMNLQSLDETESVQEGLRQIEINAVNNFDSRNPRNNQFINDLEECICKLDRLEISSIVIHVRAENRESLQKILNKIKSGRAIDWLYPMLNETDKQSLTRMRANKLLVTVRVDEEGNTVHLQPPEGCLCQLNKDTIIKNKDTLLKTLTSTDIEVLARRMKSHGLNGPILTKGEPTFLDFLIDENNPQISFCIFEEYLKSQKPSLLHSLLTDCEPQDTVVLNPNIKEHENFLAEELEVHPYLPVIQTWKNKKSTNFLKTIEECQCRSSRVEAFLNFIICEKDPTWFWEEVRKKQKYIWDYILSSRKNDAQLKRDLLAAKLISDEIVKEIDPLCLKSNMKTCTIEQLGFVDIEKIQCRKLQAEFLMNRLTMETIDEFMDALSKSGYNRIRNQIKAGSLAEKYICPRIHDKKNIYESEFDISPEHFEIFQGSEQQPVDLDVAEENAALFDEIIELLERSDRKEAEVIMLIGRSGAGKSAMINTIHKVLTGKYYHIAIQRKGTTQFVTLRRYKNCGVTLETIMNEDRKQKLDGILTKLPHIVDFVGLGDDDNPYIREILELLLGGFIPPGMHIEALQYNYRVGCLRRIFQSPIPSWRVNKVVFMQSCLAEIPKNLIECLTGVLKLTDPTTLRRKYTAEVFLLITKYDLVRDSNQRISDTTDEKSMTMEEFLKVEDEIAPEFNIVGALEANRIRWASFTDRIRSENVQIENIALKFIKRMVEPRPQASISTEPVVGVMKNIELHLFKLANQIKAGFFQDMQLNITPATILVAVLFVVVIAVMVSLLFTGI